MEDIGLVVLAYFMVVGMALNIYWILRGTGLLP
jgi:hypothetical protein